VVLPSASVITPGRNCANMKTLHVAQRYRSGTVGLFFAGLGFTYALATSGSGTTLSYGAGSRTIGTTCPRPATQFVTASDLGAVVIGTNFRRQIVVRFGIAPHTFSYADVKASPPFALTNRGLLQGIPTTPAMVYNFAIDVTDFNNTSSLRKNFTLNVIDALDSSSPLQFVTGPNLSPGATGESYDYTIEATGGGGAGGVQTYTYALADDASQQAFPQGLFLKSDGRIFGNPVIANANGYQFSIKVTDNSGASVTQKFTLPVLQGSIQTDIIASGSFKFSFGKDGSHDSLKLSLIINKDDLAAAGVRTKADLAGVPFSMNIGDVSLPVSTSTSTSGSVSSGINGVGNTFDDKGKIVAFLPVGKGGPFPQPKGAFYTVTLDPKSGILNVTFTGISLVEALGGNFRTFRTIIPVRVFIGAQAISNQNNTANTSTGSGTGVSTGTGTGTGSGTGTSTSTTTSTGTGTGTSSIASLDYEKVTPVQFKYRRSSLFGSGKVSKNDKNPPGGQFLITKVEGSEVKGSGNFDVVRLSFNGILRLPGGKPLVPNANDLVSVTVGGTVNSCLGAFPASSFAQKGGVLTFTNNDASVPLHTIKIDTNKGTIFIDMNTTEAFRLFAKDTLLAGQPEQLPIFLSFVSPDGSTVSLDAISSVVVFRRGIKLQNK
jgi:hypothetical protein